ncbi:peroxiredoxin family protein [Winogradskyella alexanderae]|uniref:TlpA family protein disulfide reductase n=1 Tax=Winogradskyella alexanderae TaxID=2877123 RepID=A0ABS7XP90_9FLAO|nr:TlpA disulfide reductase family protein [Winogradskyella alexanderae]MCA0131815.1 TlpA family protein disulfide reductase [Winogradskyella alexanderae]
MQKVLGLFMALLIVSCQSETKYQRLQTGIYRAVIEVQDNEALPFIFEVTSDSTLTISNAEERIEVDEITYVNDSIYIKTPVFNSYIAAVFDGANLRGQLINKTRKRVAPFKAEFNNDTRFNTINKPSEDVTGIWETVFSKGTKGEYIAKGSFKQQGNKVQGTFRTTTGDYRYLEGIVDGDSLRLSTFDGAHAFLFIAKVTDSTLNGQFYSGKHWKEPFVAKRNAMYELPKVEDLTFLNDGYDQLEFSFPDENQNIVSLEDERFKNKVVLVQIMGTWCPNCLDSSKYYTEFHKANKDRGFEVVALAVEFVKTPEKAFANIARLRERIGMEYPIILAQYGTGSKAKLQEKLPMLNHVMSYPTSIFVDKKGKVRKIQTGFNGPGTGDKYIEFKKDFENFIAELLAE